MKKRPDFLPTSLRMDNFHQVTALAIEEPFLEAKDALRAMQPDRAYHTGCSNWSMNKTCDGSFFAKTARQEDDVYDTNYLKYMRTLARGMKRPEPLGPLFVQ